MSDITQEVGKRLRNYRKMRHLTQEELAGQINRSKATLSKYESGEISIDIDTLYALAYVLQIRVEQLLFAPSYPVIATQSQACPAFFDGVEQFYGYLFDGRSNQIIRCVFDLIHGEEGNVREVLMFMNFRDYDSYQDCENTYTGIMEHFDAVTNISLTNADTRMEKASLQILASYLAGQTKWGLWTGFSSRPMMPVAAKMLISRNRLEEDRELLRQLKINREDIRLLKLYNMLPVI